MTDAMLPIIRQLHDAESDQTRARILLVVPDAVLQRYREVFEAACLRVGFDLGVAFIQIRRAEWHAVRGPDGRHINPLFADVREAFLEFAGVTA
ncbi:hypothetical protein IG197_27550 [Aminobacter sp. SR38]|jgi:hypothetical protein|uniref:hypothetical protein n=1 Tax=Aminobacter sp. SR38 TaxID=2774562 RepID=UPI00178679A4|nr:hypothetical protein [Aminobacter sp. SR38]QOF71454.1 hypothetical protein IG197_27550 [Aminobacter sp. SR38]